MLARLGRIALLLAVLLAQQTALAHQFWHASKAVVGTSQPAKGDALCDLHDLLGTVLGAAAGALAAPKLLALSEPGFIPRAVDVRESVLPAAHSRDPPHAS